VALSSKVPLSSSTSCACLALAIKSSLIIDCLLIDIIHPSIVIPFHQFLASPYVHITCRLLVDSLTLTYTIGIPTTFENNDKGLDPGVLGVTSSYRYDMWSRIYHDVKETLQRKEETCKKEDSKWHFFPLHLDRSYSNHKKTLVRKKHPA
jgi:hypothetical protein